MRSLGVSLEVPRNKQMTRRLLLRHHHEALSQSNRKIGKQSLTRRPEKIHVLDINTLAKIKYLHKQAASITSFI